MEKSIHNPQVVGFGTFEVDFETGELRKGGLKLKLSGQPFQVLAILLERRGRIVNAGGVAEAALAGHLR